MRVMVSIIFFIFFYFFNIPAHVHTTYTLKSIKMLIISLMNYYYIWPIALPCIWVHLMCICDQLTNFPDIVCWQHLSQCPHFMCLTTFMNAGIAQYRELLDTCCGRLQGNIVLQLVRLLWSSAVFLTPGYAEPRRSVKGNQGFRDTTMLNGGRVLLSFLNL
jgi:hypothetical protein